MTRRTLAALLLVPALLLTGCGGDDDGGSGGSGGSGGGATNPDGYTLQGEGCDSTVTLTGDVEADWSTVGVVQVYGESEVSPPAAYQSVDDDLSLQVTAVGNGFDDPTVYLLQGEDTSYAVAFGEGTVEADPDGSGATVEAEATDPGGSGRTVQISAEWSC